MAIEEQIKSARAQQRFWAKVQRGADSECWAWLGCIDARGYGAFSIGFKAIKAHRFSYITAKGLIPEGLELDHLCRNRACVNPKHLEAVTTRINCLRGDSLAAQYARRESCAEGHPLSGDNLWVRRDGSRRCRECERAYGRAKYAAKNGRKNRSKYFEVQP